MNRKSSFINAALDFLEGKGFYLVVLLCVAVVGFSGWYLATRPGGGDDPADAVTAAAPANDPDLPVAVRPDADREDAPVSGKTEIRVPAVSSPAPTRPAVTEEPAPSSTPSPTSTPTPAAEPTAATAEPAPAPLVYTWPVKGAVLTPHSTDELTYDETMGDWRVHEGLDIAAPAGTDVLAAAAGTVTAVEAHDLMGTTVVIDHGEGTVSCYANLQSVPTVSVGDAVYTGTVIGAVGDTAIAESALPAHLHFELWKDGAAVDPLSCLPEP